MHLYENKLYAIILMCIDGVLVFVNALTRPIGGALVQQHGQSVVRQCASEGPPMGLALVGHLTNMRCDGMINQRCIGAPL